MAEKKEGEFFVGYLTMPVLLTRFYRIVIPLLILFGAGFALWVSAGQKSAGSGTWDLSGKVTYQGILALEPYPVLHVSRNESVDSVLVVFEGKRGIEDLARPFAGRPVSVSGYPIKRGDWEMLEINAATDIQTLDTLPSSIALPESESLGRVSIAGEIVDSKCFLGVMKPGAGRVHRACAELCILGGLPPMLIAEDGAGRRGGYLLTAPDGASAARQVLANVAVPVTVTGELLKRGNLRYLRLDAAALK